MNNSVYILKDRAILYVNGDESREFLQNLISNDINKQMKKLLKKFSLTEVVEIVHKLTNISKKEIYGAALLIKDD